MAYLDGEADAPLGDYLALAESGDTALARELDGLRRMIDALNAAGEAWRACTAPVELSERVAALLNADAPGDGAALEAELTILGQSWAASLPPVDISGAILARVSTLRESAAAEMPEENAVALALLESRLEDLGGALKSHTPPVDVEAGVMAAVRKAAKPAAQNITPFPAKRGGRDTWTTVYRLAAAVLIMAGLTLSALWYMNGTPELRLAEQPGTVPALAATPPSPISERIAALPWSAGDSRLEGYPELRRPAPAPLPITLENKTDRFASLSMEEVLKLRRDALSKQDEALARLNELGTLTPEEARRLLEEGGLSLSAYLGVLRFLPPEEANNFLRAALEQHPDDPQLHYLLARNLALNPDTRGEALEHIAAMNSLAAGNSLGHYMEAQMRLESGDVNGALESLARASSMETASSYGLADARQHSAALQEAGMDPGIADMVALAHAGRAQYAELMALGDELLAQGESYEAAQDYETADAFYRSVQQLGVQIGEGAQLSNEQLAGFDLQMSAMDAMVRVAEIIASPDGMQMLEVAYGALAQSLSAFVGALSSVDTLFAASTPENAAALARQALQTGDLSLIAP